MIHCRSREYNTHVKRALESLSMWDTDGRSSGIPVVRESEKSRPSTRDSFVNESLICLERGELICSPTNSELDHDTEPSDKPNGKGETADVLEKHQLTFCRGKQMIKEAPEKEAD